MDFPGFHIDGSVLVALLVLLNTLVGGYTAFLARRTHEAVNGMQAQKVSDAHQAGVSEGIAINPPAAS